MSTLSPTLSSNFQSPLLKSKSFEANLEYANDSQTKVFNSRGAEYRSKRLEAADMLTTDQATDIAGVSRPTMNAWIKSGRCIGLTHLRRGFKLPKWQFEPALFEFIQPISKALNAKDGWTVLSFIESPHDALNGLSPRAHLEQGFSADEVIRLAEIEGH